MVSASIELWCRKTDLERLFSARHICYLLSGYDGRRSNHGIAELTGDLRRLAPLRDRILPVPLVDMCSLKSHDALLAAEPSLCGGACFIYYDSSDPSYGSDGNRDRQSGDLFRLIHPPAVAFQILVAGQALADGSPHGSRVALLRAFQSWVNSAGDTTPSPVVMYGQEATTELLASAESGWLRDLLDRASAIGVRDEASLNVIAAQCGPAVESKLFLCGDDGTASTEAPESEGGPVEALKAVVGAVTEVRTAIGSTSATHGHVALVPGARQEVAEFRLREALMDGYTAGLEHRYQSTVDRLRETFEQLSDLQFEYERLLNASSALQQQLGEAQQQLGEARQQLGEARQQLGEAQEQHRHADAEVQALRDELAAARDLIARIERGRAMRVLNSLGRLRQRIAVRDQLQQSSTTTG